MDRCGGAPTLPPPLVAAAAREGRGKDLPTNQQLQYHFTVREVEEVAVAKQVGQVDTSNCSRQMVQRKNKPIKTRPVGVEMVTSTFFGIDFIQSVRLLYDVGINSLPVRQINFGTI